MRVEAEGRPGILSYRFFVNASERTARGVIDYKILTLGSGTTTSR